MKKAVFFLMLTICTIEAFGNDQFVKKPESQIIIQCPHGSGKGEIGFKKRISEYTVPSEGPRAFYIDDKGNIFVLDSVNARIVKFTQNGEWLQIYPISNTTAEDMVVLGNEAYVIYTQTAIRGEVDKVDLATSKITTFKPLEELKLRYDKINVKYDLPDVSRIEKVNGEVMFRYPFLKIYIYYRPKNKSFRYESIDYYQKTRMKSRCKFNSGNVAYFRFVDDRGRGYAWKQFEAHRLFMFDDQCKQTQILLKKGTEINMPKEIILQPDGTIYQMFINQDEPFQLIKYDPVE